MQIRQLKYEIFFSQSKYAREVVKKFDLESSKHFRTSMSTTTKLSKDASGIDLEQKLYRSMIGSLLYLTVSKEENVTIFRRYIAEISCLVSKGFNTIFHGEISVRRYFGINLEKSSISRDISVIFPNISHGQRGSTKVKRATVLLQCPPICLLPRGFEPQTFWFGVHPLTTWANLPFDI